MMPRQQHALRQGVASSYGALDFLRWQAHGASHQTFILADRRGYAFRKMKHHSSAHAEFADGLGQRYGFAGGE